MKFLYVWFLVGFAWVSSLQAASTSLYEKGGGFAPAERVLYKKAFGKKEKVAEELHLEFFYPDGFAKTDSRPSIVFFFGGGWTGGDTSQFLCTSQVLGVSRHGGHLRPVPSGLEEQRNPFGAWRMLGPACVSCARMRLP